MSSTCFLALERFGFGALSTENVMKIRKELNDIILPRHSGYFERFLENSTTGWLANTAEPTVADFVMSIRLQWLVQPGVHDGIDTTILEAFPRLRAMIDKFKDLESIKAYYAAKETTA